MRSSPLPLGEGLGVRACPLITHHSSLITHQSSSGGRMTITLAEARTIIDTGLAHARSLGQPVAIAVVDAAGQVVSLDRMDGVALHRDRFATGKAFAAVVLRQRTDASAKLRETAPERFLG